MRRVRLSPALFALLAATACSKPAAGDAAPAPLPVPDSVADALPTAAPVAPGPTDIMDLVSATVIHWSVIGDYAANQLILNVSTSGFAPVTDHVELAFDYTMEGNGGLTGTPTFTDFPSTLGALRNGAEGCRAPTVSGPYEHSTIEKIENGLGGQLYLTVRTDYPAGEVPVACTGGNQASPAHSETEQVEFIVPGIALLMMGDQLTGDELRVSPDKQSLIVKRDGWTYTYTPSKVR